MTAQQSSTIIVPSEPNNHTTSQNFTLIPSATERWVTQNSDGMPNSPDDFNITFTNNPTNPSIAKRQEAILEIAITDPDWEFFGNGVEYVSSESNCNYNVDSQLSEDRKTLTITVRNVAVTIGYALGNNPPPDRVIEVQPSASAQPLAVNFRYTAKNTSTGKFYMSQDPRIVVDRPKEN
ncbi:hypothetical protein AAEU32_05915 [Pseudoalteromonas sp. SSDWG2]|uniref:hypothetical protein n=1 Tax=Pseudoalteromonas sp. SSDWG2 TaxID=3139391 RepID=UPI003BAC8319